MNFRVCGCYWVKISPEQIDMNILSHGPDTKGYRHRV